MNLIVFDSFRLFLHEYPSHVPRRDGYSIAYIPLVPWQPPYKCGTLTRTIRTYIESWVSIFWDQLHEDAHHNTCQPGEYEAYVKCLRDKNDMQCRDVRIKTSYIIHTRKQLKQHHKVMDNDVSMIHLSSQQWALMRLRTDSTRSSSGQGACQY